HALRAVVTVDLEPFDPLEQRAELGDARGPSRAAVRPARDPQRGHARLEREDSRALLDQRVQRRANVHDEAARVDPLGPAVETVRPLTPVLLAQCVGTRGDRGVVGGLRTFELTLRDDELAPRA